MQGSHFLEMVFLRLLSMVDNEEEESLGSLPKRKAAIFVQSLLGLCLRPSVETFVILETNGLIFAIFIVYFA